jgi:putative phage-type endonuclease
MNIKATIIEHAQGSEAWLQHRAKSLNASELAVAMGISSNMQRNELVKAKATGIQFEHSDFVEKRVFAPGHTFEAMARPWAEEIIGESLYPVVLAAEVDGLYLSASLDGIDVMDEETWEHKQLNAELEASLDAGVIPEQYHPQMEQGLMLANAKRCLFMASNGDRESMRCCWYESNPELRAKIIPTWKQLMADAAAYVPTAAEVKPTGKAPESLPALHIVINGGVSASNLDEFKETALGAIRSVNRELTTDVHFADAEKAVKWCSDIEDRIKAAKDHALSQTASIDALFKTMDEISAEARRVRLDLDKLVKARKEAIKGEIVAGGVAALAKFVRELNAGMPADYMPTVPADFGGCIKSLRTVDSIRNAVNTELARAKIHASEIANLIRVNVGLIDAANAPHLFAFDIKGLVLKNSEDLANVIALRLNTEEKRKADERERIRAEEATRLAREAEKAETDRAERERTFAAQLESNRIARERGEQVSAQRIRDEQVAVKTMSDREWAALPAGDRELPHHMVYGSKPAEKPISDDDGTRLTLGELNARLAPISISGAGLSELGFEPVQQIKNSRLYRSCDVPAICRAISAHVLRASRVTEAA